MPLSSKDIKYTNWYFILFVIGFTILTSYSLLINIREEKSNVESLATIEGAASYNNDLLYRRWASMHGGVYAPVTDFTPPNPYLIYIKERDLMSPSGRKLTLVNPAYMTRQVFTIAKEQSGIQSHITSLNPIRPENNADEWETEALKRFENGETEVSSIVEFEGKKYMRFMKPMITEMNCLKCHAHQGYKLGDIRGGISVSVPLEKYYRISDAYNKGLITDHLSVYIIVLTISIFSFIRFKKVLIRRNEMQLQIIEREKRLILQMEESEKLNTELRLLNDQYLTAKEKAEVSDRLKTAFLQNMSHEIRTPMNAIIGFSELLRINLDNKAKLERFSFLINKRSNDLLAIINDILDIAKIESGEVQVQYEVFNLKELLNELDAFFNEYKKKIGKHTIHFKTLFDCDISMELVETDAVKLKQILINLISNAFKFTNIGTIEVGCRSDKNNSILFYVSDTGIGIPHDKQKMIFDRFIQIENSMQRPGGTGLGLSIVKGLIDILGGTIWLESKPDSGATFFFTIPVNQKK